MNNNKTPILYTMFAVIGFFLIITGSSYALLDSGSLDNSYYNNNLIISYNSTNENAGDILSLLENYPISDEEALKMKAYSISVTNIGTDTVRYVLNIVNDESIINLDGCDENLMPDKYVKISINGSTPKTLDSFENDQIIDGLLGSNQSTFYEIRLWISPESDNSVLNTHFHKRITVVDN